MSINFFQKKKISYIYVVLFRSLSCDKGKLSFGFVQFKSINLQKSQCNSCYCQRPLRWSFERVDKNSSSMLSSPGRSLNHILGYSIRQGRKMAPYCHWRWRKKSSLTCYIHRKNDRCYISNIVCNTLSPREFLSTVVSVGSRDIVVHATAKFSLFYMLSLFISKNSIFQNS